MSRGLPAARVQGRGWADHVDRAAARIKYAARVVLIIVVGAGGFVSMAAVQLGQRPGRADDEALRRSRERAGDARGCPGATDAGREVAHPGCRRGLEAPPAMRIDAPSSRSVGAVADAPVPPIPFARPRLVAP